MQRRPAVALEFWANTFCGRHVFAQFVSWDVVSACRSGLACWNSQLHLWQHHRLQTLVRLTSHRNPSSLPILSFRILRLKYLRRPSLFITKQNPSIPTQWQLISGMLPLPSPHPVHAVVASASISLCCHSRDTARFLIAVCTYANSSVSTAPYMRYVLPPSCPPADAKPMTPATLLASTSRDCFEDWILTAPTALLRCHGLHLGNRLHLLRRRLRNRKVRCWYLGYGCPQARLDRQEYA